MSERNIQRVRAHLAKLPRQSALSFAQLRAQYERAADAFPIAPAVGCRHLHAPLRPAEWLSPPGAGDGVVMYLHGGGYVIGSPRSHRHLVAAIALAAGTRALVPEYRLAPKHPFPAALEDAIAAYRWLVDDAGVPSRQIVVAGDSAGGGLAVAMLLALRDRALPLPAAGVCLSPWVDLSCGLPSCADGAPPDPVLEQSVLREMARSYLGTTDPRTPLASPLHGDLHGLPPLLIQVGSDELLLDDGRELASRATQAGVAATLEVWEGMIHVWHWFLPMLDEAQAAVDRVGTFIRSAVE